MPHSGLPSVVAAHRQTESMRIVLDRRPQGVAVIDESGVETLVGERDLAEFVSRREAEHPRWVWTDTARWYPELLAVGVRVERCHDLRLVDALLSARAGRAPRRDWGDPRAEARADVLFEIEPDEPPAERPDPVQLLAEQRDEIAALPQSRDMTVLAAAESAGALAAAEMRHCGLPWSPVAHNALLTEALGARPAPGNRPERLQQLADEVERLLGIGPVPIDSAPELVKALRRAGLDVSSTRSWELEKLDHPAIAPLLEYRSLYRLFTANGWNWLDEWVHDGRFRPVYVPGGVVTGRWATDGGGALQLPKQVRSAVVADEGWMLVVADAAQLEPRILAALSGDEAMARASAGVDLYAGIVASGAVSSREHAKVGMLGAMYGGTTGESARVLPRLARAFPRAISFVEEAARAGERGETVSTRLGRTSPKPPASWRERQSAAAREGATEADVRAARSDARSWGRFTRNFVVQGTAAEWALTWIAGVRQRLWDARLGPLEHQPHLVMFVHDELVVHCPTEYVATATAAMRDAAAEAARVVFGGTDVTFPVTVAAVDRYSDAK